MWETRARRLFIAASLASAFMFVQWVLFVLKAVFYLQLPHGVYDFCLMLLRELGIPIHLPIMLLLAGSSLFLGMTLLVRQAAFSLRWKRRLRIHGDSRCTAYYAGLYGFNAAELSIIRSPDPVAMTIGLVNPRVVLSTGLIGMLDPNELDAVMAHERCHLQRRDPKALFFLSLMRKVFWYVPLMKWLHEKYALAIEIMADRAAMSSTSGISDLGGALLKLARVGRRPAVAISNASFAETSINLRIRMILEPHYEPAFRLPVTRFVLSMLAAMLLAILA